MERSNHDELDALIATALESYRRAEPLAGLEERIFHRVRDGQHIRGRHQVFQWALSGLAVATLLLIGIVVRDRNEPRQKTAMVSATVEPVVVPRPTTTLPQETRASTKETGRRRHARKLLPKREHFPTFAPLTAQEAALVALVQRNPEQAVQAFAQLKSVEEISIPTIDIPLLPQGDELE